jgi:hypothetical protein
MCNLDAHTLQQVKNMRDTEHFIFMLEVALNDGFHAYRQLLFLLPLITPPILPYPYAVQATYERA